MTRFSYYASAEGFRTARSDLFTSVTGLPPWGRMIVMILALPGIALIGLSLVALAASIATLLLLTVPAYVLLRRLSGWLGSGRGANHEKGGGGPVVHRPARRVEATVID